MASNFRVSLEHIESHVTHHVFRIAFGSSDGRFLLNYPEVTGLRFSSQHQRNAATFTTRYMVTAPLDEFVLNPTDRIAFDLMAYINVESTLERRWTISLESGEYCVDYCYSIDPDRRRYDYLGKGSYFADKTKPWSGSVVSNVVHCQIPEPRESSSRSR